MSTRLGRRLTTVVCAGALATLLTGNVAAYSPAGDPDGGGTTAVVRQLDGQIFWSQQLMFKLATSAGYDFLVNG